MSRGLPAHEVAGLLRGLPGGFLAAWTEKVGIRVLYSNGRIFGRKEGFAQGLGSSQGNEWTTVRSVPQGSALEWWESFRRNNAGRITILAEHADATDRPDIAEVTRESYPYPWR